MEGKGRGVVSSRPFSQGELVCEYSGALISLEEARRREEKYSEDTSVGCYMYYFSYKNSKLWQVLSHCVGALSKVCLGRTFYVIVKARKVVL